MDEFNLTNKASVGVKIEDAPCTTLSNGSTSSVQSKLRPPRKRTRVIADTAHIPRPRNAFIVFRCWFVKNRVVPSNVESDHRNISRIAGSVWNSMPAAQRKQWEDAAKFEAAEHRRLHPTYRYRPSPKRRVRQQKPPPPAEKLQNISGLVLAGAQGEELGRLAGVAVGEHDSASELSASYDVGTSVSYPRAITLSDFYYEAASEPVASSSAILSPYNHSVIDPATLFGSPFMLPVPLLPTNMPFNPPMHSEVPLTAPLPFPLSRAYPELLLETGAVEESSESQATSESYPLADNTNDDRIFAEFLNPDWFMDGVFGHSDFT